MEPVEIDPIILFVRAITGFNIKALNWFNNVFLSYLKVCIILITFYTKYLVASKIKTVFKFVINLIYNLIKNQVNIDSVYFNPFQTQKYFANAKQRYTVCR